MLEVELSMYHEWIPKEKVVKLRSFYIRCLKLRCLCLKTGSSRKSCKVAESLYLVFKVALSIFHEWIPKEKVVKLRSVYIKCLKLRCLCIKTGSPKKSCKVAESFYQVFKVACSK